MSDDPARAFIDHDHATCAGQALSHAETVCAGAGARLTPVRRRTLEILLEAHQAMGAYEVLERLSAEGFGKQPPVAYRALDFLVDQGLVHRIRRLNAFTACTQPSENHAPVFLICNACQSVAEAPGTPVREALEMAADSLGFAVERASVEAIGLCPSCQSEPTT
ncbi:MAG: Fur family transcriptional regulator [Maritimibacter sp.]